MAIVVKNAVDRKPDYLYYIDAKGNLCEAKLRNQTTTFLEKLKIKWIDFKRLWAD